MNRAWGGRAGYVTVMSAVIIAATAGCGGGDPGSDVSSSSAAATSTAQLTAPAPLGSERSFTGDGETVVRVTVLNFAPAAAPEAPAPPGGGHWVGAEVQSCVDAAMAPTAVSWSEWSVLDATDGRYPASSVTYPQFPRPEYPFSVVGVGDCVRGWVVFPVADGAMIDRVRYTPNESVNATWSTAGATPPAAEVPPSPAVQEAPPVEVAPEPAPVVVETVEEAEPAPAPAGVVTVGQPCSSPSDIGTDVNTGGDIVCVYMGPGGGTKWVMSAPISGVNNVGDACNPATENVSSTPAGKAIMCAGGEWMYGP
ncbi:hypothetical protein [Rhodococcus tukisamuensis]|uniref:Uncharacterized protein n=1 Tax=Rhodococcus tukisamuensis TaxID=168276 RepID=A0A1G6MMK9_9NOCA|nr:hypothetical protein [Rhodococcus tukisamuensis]SDC56467.1 hypothetical protein SAMN05444580_101229 [Rhodococcus tukisamuensis]